MSATGHAARVVILIEARMGSTRLPGKVLRPLAGKPLLGHLIERIRATRECQQIMIATSVESRDDALEAFAEEMGVACFRGSEEDVLSRLAGAAEASAADVVVSLTGDNPMLDAELIDDMVRFFREGGYDYVSNTYMQHTDKWPVERTFPRGISAQVYWARLLREIDEEFVNHAYREHVTFGIYHRDDGKYKLGAFQAEGKYAPWNHPELRFTVDTPEDYELMSRIFAALTPDDPLFSSHRAIEMVLQDGGLREINAEVKQKIAYREA